MKAYLVKIDSVLLPFQKPASQICFRAATVRLRLEQQLTRNGLQIVDVDALGNDKIEPGSLVLQDNVLLSDNFISKLIKSIPSRNRNYQCEVDVCRYPVFSVKDPVALVKKLPVYYCGEGISIEALLNDDGGEFVPLPMHPATLVEVNRGLPTRINKMTDIRAYVLEYYAIELEYWFDIQTATSLYARELVSKIAILGGLFLPQWLLKKSLEWQWATEKINWTGKNCRIHPTAILEGCLIGDNVEVGPYSYLRLAVIADNAVIQENSSVKASYIGEGAFIMGSDVVNSYVGAESSIITPKLYNVVFGERSFVSGGSGFADFNVGSGGIMTTIDGIDIPSGLNYLGSGVGDDCFIGANMIFAPGRTIPNGSNFLDNGLLKTMPTDTDGTYALSGKQFLQIPNTFLGDSTS